MSASNRSAAETITVRGRGFNLELYRNSDGETYNGVALISALSGILGEDEVRWTFTRMKALRAEGKTKAEVLAIVKEEAKGKPWLSR